MKLKRFTVLCTALALTGAAVAPAVASEEGTHRLAERLPTLRFLSRSQADIEAQAHRLREPVAQRIGAAFTVDVGECHSQIGSGALPLDTLASAALVIRARGSQRELEQLASTLRARPRPVIGRIADGALRLDLRCLSQNEEAPFLASLDGSNSGIAHAP